MTTNESGEQVREYYRQQGRDEQEIFMIKKMRWSLCNESKTELCDHEYCHVVLDMIHKLTAHNRPCPSCGLKPCRCDDIDTKRKYPEE